MSVTLWQSNSLCKHKKEQWFCENQACNTTNYIYRSACRRCNYPRHGLKLALTNSRAGDWYCQADNCYELNFGVREKCRACGSVNTNNKEQRQYFGFFAYHMNKMDY